MKKFFKIKSSRTWLNAMMVEAIYQVGNEWHIRTASGAEYPITEDEYFDIIEKMMFCHQEKKPDHNEKD